MTDRMRFMCPHCYREASFNCLHRMGKYNTHFMWDGMTQIDLRNDESVGKIVLRFNRYVPIRDEEHIEKLMLLR